MTPQAKQELTKKLRADFDTPIFQFTGKPDESIPFTFKYTGDIPIHSIQPGCGCTEAILDKKTNTITGHLKLDPLKNYGVQPGQVSTFISKNISVYFVDAQEWFIVNEKGNRVNNPNKVHVALSVQGNVMFN